MHVIRLIIDKNNGSFKLTMALSDIIINEDVFYKWQFVSLCAITINNALKDE